MPSIVALVSEGRRAAVARLVAERTSVRSGGGGGGGGGALLFAANSEELERSVTSDSLVVIEGSRLGELAAAGRTGGPLGSAAKHATERGTLVQSWLVRLPASTRAAFEEALDTPRAWSVKRVAHVAGVSTRQLVRQCHLAGCAVPPKDILLAARLAAAQKLVRGPRRATAVALAHACGWVDGRSLRTALRRIGLPSIAALAEQSESCTTLSDLVARLDRHRT